MELIFTHLVSIYPGHFSNLNLTCPSSVAHYRVLGRFPVYSILITEIVILGGWMIFSGASIINLLNAVKKICFDPFLYFMSQVHGKGLRNIEL